MKEYIFPVVLVVIGDIRNGVKETELTYYRSYTMIEKQFSKFLLSFLYQRSGT